MRRGLREEFDTLCREQSLSEQQHTELEFVFNFEVFHGTLTFSSVHKSSRKLKVVLQFSRSASPGDRRRWLHCRRGTIMEGGHSPTGSRIQVCFGLANDHDVLHTLRLRRQLAVRLFIIAKCACIVLTVVEVQTRGGPVAKVAALPDVCLFPAHGEIELPSLEVSHQAYCCVLAYPDDRICVSCPVLQVLT